MRDRLCELSFLGTFAKLRETTVSFVVFFRPSFCPHGTCGLPLGGFSLNFSIFRKYAEKIQVPLKSDKKKGTLLEDRYTFLIVSRSFLLVWEMFQTEVVGKIKPHILRSAIF